MQKQQNYPSLEHAMRSAVSVQEAKDVPKCYYFHNDTLFRKWRPPSRPADEDRAITEQVVLPKCYRQVLQLVHASLFGHMAAKKTLEKLSQYLYWPSMWKDMKLFWRRCHVCQVVEKPSVSNPVLRDAPSDLGFSPFELVFRHKVRGHYTCLRRRRLNQRYLEIFCFRFIF